MLWDVSDTLLEVSLRTANWRFRTPHSLPLRITAERHEVLSQRNKDLAQLITEADIWWSYLDDKKLDYRAICKKFGVRPEQIAINWH